MLRKWGMIALILLATPALVFAQNTGKIQGVVTDADTGDPLPGASVLIVGTTMGTITDVDGNYFIIGVPVGAHDVQASFVGYQTQTSTGVDVSSGYTQVLNFSLPAGVELDEIIIEYERPLIQQDAIGVPKIVDAEQIVNLPVRGSAELAKIQPGVVAAEGSGTLYVRGGRSSEVDYYIDGVKVFGSQGLPQSAVQEQEMLIGSISARYGDAMSGIINITTKSGSADFFGSFEAITSEAFDDFGYNLASGAIGGPIIGEKMSFFLSAEYLDQADDNPRAYGQLRVTDDALADLHSAPTAFRVEDGDGNQTLLPIPASVSDGSYLRMDSDGHVDTSDGFITFFNAEGEVDTQIPIADGLDIATNADGAYVFTPANRSILLEEGNWKIEDVKRKNAQYRLSLNGNVSFNVLENARIRVGGRRYVGEADGNPGVSDVMFNHREETLSHNDDYQVFGTWTHYLSNNTFYQLQADYSVNTGESWDPEFGKDRNDLFRYSDVDGEDEFLSLRGYKEVELVNMEILDSNGDAHTVAVPTFTNTYSDGQGLSQDGVFNLVQTTGREFNGYSKNRSEQFRFSASATTQVGLHQLEFGGEYEKRTYRGFSIGSAMSRYYNDGLAENARNDSRLNPDGYTDFYDMPDWLVASLTGNRGYDIWGDEERDDESLAGLLDTDINKPASDYNVAPYEPIFYGGYIQDKIEFRDIVLNLGLRVDVFDNNQRVLIDQFARRPVERVGDYSGSLSIPSNMQDDYVIYYSGNDIVGFRSIRGDFFDANGQSANAGDISLNGKPNQLDTQITEDMFEDYDPAVTVMPRIGVSFPVTDQALFFASYGVVAQRPSSRVDASLSSLTGTGGINNSNLQPEKTTSYELGFRQRIGTRMAFTVSGFFKQVENLIQRRELRYATPNVYSAAQNVDFGTIKGFELGFDIRRTQGFSANINYTLSFADGTGSGSNTTGTIIWVSETPPNFISPLDFDQRHNLNISLDYRLGQGEGPTILGGKLLQNTGVNVLFTAKSGFPYTAVNEPENLAGGAKPEAPRGTINGDYSPGQSRVDLRIDRRFQVGNADLSAFIWVQNLFDQTNINNVWRYTGLPDDDGFLATPAGISMIQGSSNPTWNRELYEHRNRGLGNVGIPRLTRIGLRLDF